MRRRRSGYAAAEAPAGSAAGGAEDGGRRSAGPASWLRRCVGYVRSALSKSKAHAPASAPAEQPQQHAPGLLDLPRPALLLIVKRAGPAARAACKELQELRREALRDPAYAAACVLLGLQRSPCWPACSHCHRKGALKPGSAGSAAAGTPHHRIGLTRGCGSRLLRWLLRHAPEGEESAWLLGISHLVLQYDSLRRGEGQSSQQDGELLSLQLSGMGCCGEPLARISLPVRAAVLTRLRTAATAGDPPAAELLAGVESGLAAACFHGDAWAFDQLMPLLRAMEPNAAQLRKRLWPLVQLAAWGDTPAHTELLRRLIGLGAPVENIKCRCVADHGAATCLQMR
jgi:hypothetical protein